MKRLLAGVLVEIGLRAHLCVRGGPLPGPAALRRRPGQTTVEYLLMLAVVAGMAAMMAILFHKRILGGIFTMVGMIIGAGTPK